MALIRPAAPVELFLVCRGGWELGGYKALPRGSYPFPVDAVLTYLVQCLGIVVLGGLHQAVLPGGLAAAPFLDLLHGPIIDAQLLRDPLCQSDGQVFEPGRMALPAV